MTAHPRRWFQLSLKSLFLLTLLVATFFAGYTVRGRHDGETMRAEQEARKLAEESARRAERALQRALFHGGVDDLRVPSLPQ